MTRPRTTAQNWAPGARATGLTALTRRYGLTPGQAIQLEALLSLLEDDERAPTTVRERQGALDVHLADSLVGLELEPIRRARRAVDIGSGAGFPGLPLAIALPACEVTLLESTSRKCAFLDRARTATAAVNVRVACARAENWAPGLEASDLATARALAAPAVVLEYAAPLLAKGGHLVDWRARLDAGDERAALAAAGVLGLRLVETVRVEPFVRAQHRTLYVYVKVRSTPPGYPRRPGIARKRPVAP